MSRADDERIADILDAARQITEVVDGGSQAGSFSLTTTTVLIADRCG